ncbi:MAG: hypothetical protein WCO02_14110, partial [Bacteroidota bacterium]
MLLILILVIMVMMIVVMVIVIVMIVLMIVCMQFRSDFYEFIIGYFLFYDAECGLEKPHQPGIVKLVVDPLNL